MFVFTWLLSVLLLCILLLKKQAKWGLDFWDYLIISNLWNLVWLGLSVIYFVGSA